MGNDLERPVSFMPGLESERGRLRERMLEQGAERAAMARSAEPVARPWGKASRRRAARRLDKVSGRAAGDGSGATEPRRRKDGVLPSAPASARDRHRTAKTAKRASWSRAGRSRARRNRARRPVRRTGRAPNPFDRRRGRRQAVIGDDGRCPASDRVRGMPHQGRHKRNGGGVQCGFGKKEEPIRGRWRRAKRGGDMPFAERRAAALRREGQPLERNDRRAPGDGALAPSRSRDRVRRRVATRRRREPARRWRASGAPSPSRTLSVDVRLWQQSKRGEPVLTFARTGSRERGKCRITPRRNTRVCPAASPCRRGSR